MVEKMFDAKFLHLLTESSSMIGTVILLGSSVGPEPCPIKYRKYAF